MTTTLHTAQTHLYSPPGLVLIPDQPDAPRMITKPTDLPGPKARALAERDSQVLSPSYTRPYVLVVDHAIGSVVTDVDGNDFLDMTAGIAVTATGHCHPHVLAAIRRQIDRCLHMSGTDFYYEPQVELAERLAALAPMAGPNRVFFTNSGAEAVEAALKLARFHTGRKHVIAFFGAFHGRTCGALSLTASKVVQRRLFGPLLPEVSHVDYPRTNAWPLTVTSTSDSIGQIEQLFHRTVAPDEVAAIFVEPIQGEGGYIVPPDDFLPRLRELCDEYGILLVLDEVQTGMGRTGRMWASQHVNVEPDIVLAAKGIASGLPLGAMITREAIMHWPPGAHASTFGGNPVSCVAALATIELLEAGLIENARLVGDHLLDRLQILKRSFACIGDVRGRGLMAAIELADPDLRNRVIEQCYRRGLLLLGCGESAIRFSPALTVSTQQIDVAVGILHEVLNDES